MRRSTGVRLIAGFLVTVMMVTGISFNGGWLSHPLAARRRHAAMGEKISKAKAPKLNKKSVTLTVGKMMKLNVSSVSKADKIVWKSSNKAVVSVDKKGVVKGKKRGKATVRAFVTLQTGKRYTLTCKFNIKKDKKVSKKRNQDVKNGIVTNQKDLNKVLASKRLETLLIKTDKEVRFEIPEGKYENVTLTVDAPKADVVNNGRFAGIIIKNIKADTWYEKAIGNQIRVLAKKARIIVEEEADVSGIFLQEDEKEKIVIEVNGKVKTIQSASKAKAKLMVGAKGSLETVELNKESEIALHSEGEVERVQISALTKIDIKGTKKQINLELTKGAEGSEIKSSLPLDMKVGVKSEIILEKGAEGSKIEVSDKSVEIRVLNHTEKKVEIKTEHGVMNVESGKEGKNTQIKEKNSNDLGGMIYVPEVIGKSERIRPLSDRGPLMGAYYRTWHDMASTGDDGASHGGLNKMSEIPEEVDLAFVFADWTAKDSKFWSTLRNEYVPILRKQGTRVIRTIGIRDVTSERGVLYEKNLHLIDTRNTDADTVKQKYAEYARVIYDEYVAKYDLDGLDIDLEQHDEPNNPAKRTARKDLAHGINEDVRCHKQDKETEEQKFLQAIGIIKELKNIIGYEGHGIGQILILDTTIPANNSRIFQDTATLWDYILVQKYGKDLAKVENGKKENYGQLDWKDFKRFGVKPEYFLYGFSFYEEDGDKNNNVWSDTVSLKTTGVSKRNDEPFDPKNKGKKEWKWHLRNEVIEEREPGTPKDSNAYCHSVWQPDDGVKGGIFSYAIDRDGVKEGIDPFKEKCGKRNENDPKSISEQSDYYGKWGDNTKHLHTTYKWTKELKQLMMANDDYQPITEADIPDDALRAEVLKVLGKNWRGNIKRYSGELILNNPEIKNLVGLNQFENLKKLTLSGLVNLKSLTVADLPPSLREDYQGAPYHKAEERLVLESLTGLEDLNLNEFDLEHLPVKNPESFISLKNLQVSRNRIDFSAGEDNKKLERLLTIVQGNGGGLFTFDGQRPQGYAPTSFSYRLKGEMEEEYKIYVGTPLEIGLITANETQIVDNVAFDALKNTKILSLDQLFIDPNYTLEAFRTYNNRENDLNNVSFEGESARDKVSIIDHTGKDVTAGAKNGISNSIQETYFLKYTKFYPKWNIYDKKGNFMGTESKDVVVHECKLIIGDELEKAEQLTNGAAVIGTSFSGRDKLKNDSEIQSILFNGKRLEDRKDAMISTIGEEVCWIAFDLGEKAVAKQWNVINQYTGFYGDPQSEIKAGELQYFTKEVTGTPSQDDLADDENWEKADSFDSGNDSAVPVHTGIIGQEEGIKARYWRYKITKREYGVFVPLCLSELLVTGKRDEN